MERVTRDDYEAYYGFLNIDYTYSKQKALIERYNRLGAIYYTKDNITFCIPNEPVCMKVDGDVRKSIKTLLRQYYTNPTQMTLKKLAAKHVTIMNQEAIQ